jgi:NAD-dependent SIR2 family protein deacetylase
MSYRKNVYVLGAGFSSDAGSPVMDDFFRCARDLRDDPRSPLTEYDRKIFARIIDYRFGLNRALAKILVDLDNIEKLFGFLEMDLQLSARVDAQLRHDMRYLIARTLEVSTQKSLRQDGCHILTGKAGETKYPYVFGGTQYAFFLGLASGLWNPTKSKDGRAVDSVITFNYDLVLEREMSRFKIRPDYFCGTSAAYYRNAFDGSRSNITLLKLHGSVNWFTCPKCKRLYYFGPDAAQIGNIGNYVCQNCTQFSLEPLIVPPTWNKGIEEDFIRPVWSQALVELISAGRLFIVGYSFPETDQFFTYMLGLALAYNDQLSEIHIVNPSPKAGETFTRLFNPYFEQRVVTFHQERTENFVPAIQHRTRQEIDAGNLDSSFVRR